MSSILSLIAQHAGGGAPGSIPVDPGQHPDAQQGGGGGDPVAALKQALDSLHSFVEGADDEADKQIALQCYAKLQSILANEQKEKEQALGVTPQTKFLAKNASRGSY